MFPLLMLQQVDFRRQGAINCQITNLSQILFQGNQTTLVNLTGKFKNTRTICSSNQNSTLGRRNEKMSIDVN